jgi:hypothetical protein
VYREVHMIEQSTFRTTVSCLVAVMVVVGFTAAPAAAFADDETVGDTVDDTLDDGVDVDTADSDGSDTEGVEVNIVRANSPVETGETLVVTVDVKTNDGGSTELLVDGESKEERGFAPGQEDRVNVTWETGYQDAGNHTATVKSGFDGDSVNVTVEPGAQVPEETCTNVPKRANENVPYEELPSQDDLPEDAPNPVPPFVTPEAVAGIVVGAAPNQCDIQDPNDPSVDPEDPPSDPDITVIVLRSEQYKDGAAFLVYYEATLDDDGGPEVDGFAGGVAYSSHLNTDPSTTVNDSEKEYTVDPMVDGDTSTAKATADAEAPFGGTGGSLECSGGECQPGSSGVPTFAEYPAVPAPVWDGEE